MKVDRGTTLHAAAGEPRTGPDMDFRVHPGLLDGDEAYVRYVESWSEEDEAEIEDLSTVWVFAAHEAVSEEPDIIRSIRSRSQVRPRRLRQPRIHIGRFSAEP